MISRQSTVKPSDTMDWIPAFAGMTALGFVCLCMQFPEPIVPAKAGIQPSLIR